MRIDVLTIFPEVFEPYASTSMLGRARERGILDFRTHNLREWTHDRHHTTDDEPYGGGAGQLMLAEPIFEALDDLQGVPAMDGTFATTIFFTPTGRPFDQRLAEELAQQRQLIMVCGRYEGIDERAYSRADLCISLGDYVLTGGELAALTVTDALCRLLPGVLGNAASAADESFSTGLLEYPQYTRPAELRGLKVPDVLLSGNHAEIAKWRREQALERTQRLRPDLLGENF
ncbi:MAG: tRNA (guanosine(37)-N1)-methyltransferase TrmD [Coriobacteriales bacterium]|jgi:tRNA (guanine37-N1)-methyltransferase|nr:tRNA (guanosine(37)-N1)-methyltransferase TrmD [Coriobacteriales bacterium]